MQTLPPPVPMAAALPRPWARAEWSPFADDGGGGGGVDGDERHGRDASPAAQPPARDGMPRGLNDGCARFTGGGGGGSCGRSLNDDALTGSNRIVPPLMLWSGRLVKHSPAPSAEPWAFGARSGGRAICSGTRSAAAPAAAAAASSAVLAGPAAENVALNVAPVWVLSPSGMKTPAPGRVGTHGAAARLPGGEADDGRAAMRARRRPLACASPAQSIDGTRDRAPAKAAAAAAPADARVLSELGVENAAAAAAWGDAGEPTGSGGTRENRGSGISEPQPSIVRAE